LSKQLIDSFASITLINGLGDQGMYEYAKDSLNDDKKKKYVLDFLKYGDIGIEDISEGTIVEMNGKEYRSKNIKILASVRKKFNENLVSNKMGFAFMGYESEGTKKLFELSPYIYDAIINKTPLIQRCSTNFRNTRY